MSHSADQSLIGSTGVLPQTTTQHRRRIVLEVIAEEANTMSLADLAEKVAAREDTSNAVSSDELAIMLHHIHLPRLHEAKVIDYNPRRHTIDPAVTM